MDFLCDAVAFFWSQMRNLGGRFRNPFHREPDGASEGREEGLCLRIPFCVDRAASDLTVRQKMGCYLFFEGGSSIDGKCAVEVTSIKWEVASGKRVLG